MIGSKHMPKISTAILLCRQPSCELGRYYNYIQGLFDSRISLTPFVLRPTDKTNDKTVESSAMYWSNEDQNLAHTWCIKTNVQKNDKI